MANYRRRGLPKISRAAPENLEPNGLAEPGVVSDRWKRALGHHLLCNIQKKKNSFVLLLQEHLCLKLNFSSDDYH